MHAFHADVRDVLAWRSFLMYLLLGTWTWAVTSMVFARHVAEPLLFRLVSRNRLLAGHRSPLRLPRQSRKATVQSSDCERYADVLDAIGRELRLGASLHAAILRAIERHRVEEWHWLTATCGDGRALVDIARNAHNHHECFALRSISVAAEGGDAVHAVETAARTLRTTAALAAESQSAAAHTKASMSVLTWVPMILVLWLLVRHPTARSFFLSPLGLTCLSAGSALQWVGRRWVHRMSAHACRLDSDVPDFIDVVSVHLRAGKPPALAFLAAADNAPGEFGEIARRVVEDVRTGTRFVDALATHRRSLGVQAQALVDGLIDTERDGLPPRQLFERLATDAHTQRRREVDARIRALPVRLTLPLVGCILPAYVMLGVIPLLLSHFSSVHVDPQT